MSGFIVVEEGATDDTEEEKNRRNNAATICVSDGLCDQTLGSEGMAQYASGRVSDHHGHKQVLRGRPC